MNRRNVQIVAWCVIVLMLLVAVVPAAAAGNGPAPLAAGKVPWSTYQGLLQEAASRPSAYPIVAGGLDNPRELTFGPDGALYIAESGRGGAGPCLQGPEGEICYGPSGAVTRVMNGMQERIATGMVSLAAPDGSSGGGPQGVAVDAGGDVYALVGLGADPALRDPGGPLGTAGMNFGQLTTIPGDGSWSNWVDVSAYETLANPDGGALDSNPFGLLAVDDGLLATDAGGNDLLHISSSGVISTVAVFPDRMVEFPPGSGNFIPMQAVPTSVVEGPDGAYYVGELTGFPFPIGGANVYRVVPGQMPEVYAGGFTNILGLAFGSDGSLYVLEMAKNSLLSGDPTGAIVRMAPDGSRSEVASEGLFLPTGMAMGPDGALYVANFGILAGAAHVVRITVSASISTSPMTAMVGSTVDVSVHGSNYAAAQSGLFYIVPLDTGMVQYVAGSATGGAFPITIPVGQALALLKQGGVAALKAAGGDSHNVVAIAWQGDQASGQAVDFGFQVMVQPGAAGQTVSLAVEVYQMGMPIAGGTAGLVVAPLNAYETILQNGRSGYAGATDTTISGWAPATNYGMDSNLYVRQPNGKSALVRFDLSGVPPLAQVTTARLGLWVTFVSPSVQSYSPLSLNAYQVLKSWSETGATWMMADGTTSWQMPGAMGPEDRSANPVAQTLAYNRTGQWIWFDLPNAAVQQWVADPSSNYGVVIAGEGAINGEIELISSNFVDTGVRPQMRITYLAP